jgi:hypothetical protein
LWHPAALHGIVKYARIMVVEIAHCNPIAFWAIGAATMLRMAIPQFLSELEAGASFSPLNAGHRRSGHIWGMKRLRRGHSLRDS